MNFLGYENRDKILVFDENDKAVALIHLANKDERTGNKDDMIIKTEAAPKIESRPEMWTDRKNCKKIINGILKSAELSYDAYYLVKGWGMLGQK